MTSQQIRTTLKTLMLRAAIAKDLNNYRDYKHITRQIKSLWPLRFTNVHQMHNMNLAA